MRAALALELLKLRRSPAARVASGVLVLVVPVACAAMVALARSDSDSPLAVKARPMLLGTGWEAYLGMLAQMMSVAVLLAVGIVVSWVVGREFADGTVGALLALPTPPRQILVAKLTVALCWALVAALLAVLVAVLGGWAIGLGPVDVGALRAAGRVLVVAALMAVLSLPLAWVATVLRGYLAGISALLGVVVVAQVVTAAGAGAWFPYAAPALWSGMGGAQASAAVTPGQLLLALPVGVAGAWAAAHRWQTAELV
jgi:ABC-2 type transport system permease protein